MFSESSNKSSEDITQFFDGKKTANKQNRSNNGTKQKPVRNFVVLSKLTKALVYVTVGAFSISGGILYYNLSGDFAGTDAAQAIYGIPVVLGVIVSVLLVNTSSEDNQA